MITPKRTSTNGAYAQAITQVMNSEAVFLASINSDTGKLEMTAFINDGCEGKEDFTALVSELKLTCYKYIEAAQQKNFGEIQLNAVKKDGKAKP